MKMNLITSLPFENKHEVKVRLELDEWWNAICKMLLATSPASQEGFYVYCSTWFFYYITVISKYQKIVKTEFLVFLI